MSYEIEKTLQDRMNAYTIECINILFPQYKVEENISDIELIENLGVQK